MAPRGPRSYADPASIPTGSQSPDPLSPDRLYCGPLDADPPCVAVSRRRFPPTALLLLPVLLASVLTAATEALLRTAEARPAGAESTGVLVHRVEGGIRVDARMDERVWREATPVELPLEIQPAENTPAPVRTECRVAYDDSHVYVYFTAWDPAPEEIRAHLSDRDAHGDDAVGLFLDPFNDGLGAYQFLVNPFGVQTDLLRTRAGFGEDMSWDAIWDAAGRITADGYEVEMAIPLSAMRLRRDAGAQSWGFMALRIYPRSVEHQLASHPFDRGRNCLACQFGELRGFESIEPGRDLEVSPTFTAMRTDVRPEAASSMRDGDPETAMGMSMRWGVTPNLKLAGAIHPDFSQVEADAAQLTVNERFAVFYSEKRPFFMESSDLFETPLQAIYTRTVVSPEWGAKLTGAEGADALGLFAARDEATWLSFPSNGGTRRASLDRSVTAAAGRYRRDLGASSTVGALATWREGDGYRNRVYGLDGSFRFAGSHSVQAQILRSDTEYPDDVAVAFDQPRGAFSGLSGRLGYEREGRAWGWWAHYEGHAAHFRADAGYIPRVDMQDFGGGLRRDWRPDPGSFLTQVQIGLEASRTTDEGGVFSDQGGVLFGMLGGAWQSYLRPGLEFGTERFAGRDYDRIWPVLRGGFQPTGSLRFWGAVGAGDAIDYAHQRPADQMWGGPGFSWNLGRHLHLWADHTYERMSIEGRRLYTANLIQTRLVYQFNVRTFVRAVVQYVDIRYTPELYARSMPEGSRDLFGQFLFSYKVDPQTVVYLGYTDNRLGETVAEMQQQDRTFFGKIGYAWAL